MLKYFTGAFLKRIPIIAVLSAVVYFSFHILNGNRGVFSYISSKRDYAVLLKRLDELREQNARLENKIRLLKTKIDIDLLEELTIKVLALAHKGDNVIKR